MKPLKRTASALAAAVIAISAFSITGGCALSAYADSPPTAGKPTGAELYIEGATENNESKPTGSKIFISNILPSQNTSDDTAGKPAGSEFFNPDTNKDATENNEQKPKGSKIFTSNILPSQNTSDNTAGKPAGSEFFNPDASRDPENPEPGSVDKTFLPPEDRTRWKLWDGTAELLDNTDYYISDTVSIDGEFILPANSRLLIDAGALMRIYTESSFDVLGTMIIAPKAELVCSGTFSVSEGSLLENFGNLKFSLNSVVNISSVLAAYSGSQTVMAGQTFVYGKGKLADHGTVFVTQLSETTLTGEWLVCESGMMYLNGNFTTTLSGKFDIAGYTYLQEHAHILNSGRIFIEPGVKYYVDKNAKITNTQSGRITDSRKPETIPATTEIRGGIKGIDVSVWQGVIDWQKVKDAGVQFAIIRSSSGPRVDTMFDYNITEAQKAGILVGVYHYCYALTPEEAREEAQHFIETIEPYRIDYPVMFDFEDNSQAKLGKARLTEIAAAFLAELKNAGYYPMIYSYRNWLENNLDMNRLSEYEVALAEWNVAIPKYTGPYGIWQYSCKGQISGIEGDVDLDICYKDYARIIREGGYNKLK